MVKAKATKKSQCSSNNFYENVMSLTMQMLLIRHVQLVSFDRPQSQARNDTRKAKIQSVSQPWPMCIDPPLSTTLGGETHFVRVTRVSTSPYKRIQHPERVTVTPPMAALKGKNACNSFYITLLGNALNTLLSLLYYLIFKILIKCIFWVCS